MKLSNVMQMSGNVFRLIYWVLVSVKDQFIAEWHLCYYTALKTVKICAQFQACAAV